jgi:hypothetical protein
MGKQQISQIDLIKTLLDNNHIDESKVLIEKEKNHNGISFEMKREIKCHRDINYVLYRFDPTKIKLFPYFSSESGLHKICDYFLFAEEGQHLYLLLIELKKGTESAQKQLLASHCFADFIIASARRIGFPLTDNIVIHKIRVSEERAKKRNKNTKPKQLTADVNGIINYDHSNCFRIKEIIEILPR